jgi:hypothetical protein
MFGFQGSHVMHQVVLSSAAASIVPCILEILLIILPSSHSLSISPLCPNFLRALTAKYCSISFSRTWSFGMKTSVQQPPPSKPRAVPTTNKTSAPKQKRFVSAANVFKQRAPKTTTALHPNLQAHGSAVHKANTHLQADTESPTKLFSEESDSSKHPLAVAFNGK